MSKKVKYFKVEDVVDLLNKRLEQSSYKNLAVQYEIRVILQKLAELPTADLEALFQYEEGEHED